MGFLTKEGLQNLTNKLVQGDAIKVASHRGKNVKEVIDNIQRECENVALPNSMTLENRVNEFKVGQGRDVDVSGDVEEGKIEVGLSGRTYQNLTGFGVDFQTQHSGVFEKMNDENSLLVKRISSNDSGWAYWYNNKLKRTLIKPNTKYTLLFKFDSNKNHNLQVSLRDGSSRNPISNQISATRVFSNIYMVELITVSSFNELGNGQVVYLHGGVPPKKGDWSRYYKDIILLEGDHTQTPTEELPKYFEGIKSSFEDGVVDIEVQGKNLFDGVYRFDYLQGGDVTIYCERESGDTRLALVKVEPYTTYTIKKERSVRNTMALFKEFPKDGDYYKSIVLSDLGTTIKTGDNNYLAVYVSNESEEPFLQVEKLNYPTPYEPYYKKKISFNIGEPLRSLPNGVCDEIRNNNGQWELIRRTGEIVLNGSETYTPSSPSENTMFFILGNILCQKNGYCISNNFYYEIGSKDNEHIRINANGNIVFWLNISKLPSQDIEGLKQ